MRAGVADAQLHRGQMGRGPDIEVDHAGIAYDFGPHEVGYGLVVGGGRLEPGHGTRGRPNGHRLWTLPTEPRVFVSHHCYFAPVLPGLLDDGPGVRLSGRHRAFGGGFTVKGRSCSAPLPTIP